MNAFNKGFGLTFILIVIAAVLAAGGSYWYVQNKYQPSVAAPTVQTATSAKQENAHAPATSNPNLRTYTNSQYGFSVQYPSDFQQQADFSKYGYPTMTPPLLYVENPSDIAENILVGASNDPADVSGCISTTSASTIVTINGMTFHRFDGTDPAAGQEGLSHEYVLVRNGTCYWIRTSFVGTEIGHLNTQAEKNAELASESNTFEKLDVAVTSFKLVNTSQLSVPGMSQYTDKDFGFSFWYPSSWTVTPSKGQAPPLQGVVAVNALDVMSPDGQKGFRIDAVHSNNRSVTTYPTGVGRGGCELIYSFDTSLHTWMISTQACDGSPNTQPADVSNNSMGGLHEFSGASIQTILPLSASNFLAITYVGDENYTARLNETFLANTVAATDPSVATPVSAAQQTATIQAEKAAYANQ